MYHDRTWLCASNSLYRALYLSFFKFSVELKTEFGMRNVLIQDDTPFSAAFDELRTRSFIISFTFEG